MISFTSRVSRIYCRKLSSTSTCYPVLEAAIRETGDAGSLKSRRLRKDGRVPGVLYGVDDDNNVVKTMVTVDKKCISKEMRTRLASLENTVYQLKLGDDVHLVTPRQLQMNPITDEPLAVNFLKYRAGNRMRIPVKFINQDQSVDLKRGCFMVHVNRFVECLCEKEVPAVLNVDLTGMKNGDVLRLAAVQLPTGVRPAPSVPLDCVLGVIKSGRK